MKIFYIVFFVTMFSFLDGYSIGVLLQVDQGTECTRTRLADFHTERLSSIDLESYFRVYSDNLDEIKIRYNDIYTQCRSKLYYPMSPENSDKNYSTYFFIEYENEGLKTGDLEVLKILRIEIFTEPPYKYKSIKYIDADQEKGVIDKANEFIVNDVDRMKPPPPFAKLFNPSEVKVSCFNYPRLFEVEPFDIANMGTENLKIHYINNNQIPHATKLDWIRIHNEIDYPVIVSVSDMDTLNLEELSMIDNIAIRYTWIDQKNIKALGIEKVRDIYIRYKGGENELTVPCFSENAKELTALKIAGLESVDTLDIPECVLKLPNLRKVEIKKSTMLRDKNFYFSMEKYFKLTRLDKRGSLFEKKE